MVGPDRLLSHYCSHYRDHQWSALCYLRGTTLLLFMDGNVWMKRNETHTNACPHSTGKKSIAP